MIEVCETKEAVDAVDHHGCRPFHNSFYLGVVHLDAIMVDKLSKVLDFCFVKRALFWACEEIVIPKPLKNFLHLGLMFSKRTFGEDHDVVNVDNDHVFHVCE